MFNHFRFCPVHGWKSDNQLRSRLSNIDSKEVNPEDNAETLMNNISSLACGNSDSDASVDIVDTYELNGHLYSQDSSCSDQELRPRSVSTMFSDPWDSDSDDDDDDDDDDDMDSTYELVEPDECIFLYDEAQITAQIEYEAQRIAPIDTCLAARVDDQYQNEEKNTKIHHCHKTSTLPDLYNDDECQMENSSLININLNQINNTDHNRDILQRYKYLNENEQSDETSCSLPDLYTDNDDEDRMDSHNDEVDKSNENHEYKVYTHILTKPNIYTTSDSGLSSEEEGCSDVDYYTEDEYSSSGEENENNFLMSQRDFANSSRECSRTIDVGNIDRLKDIESREITQDTKQNKLCQMENKCDVQGIHNMDNDPKWILLPGWNMTKLTDKCDSNQANRNDDVSDVTQCENFKTQANKSFPFSPKQKDTAQQSGQNTTHQSTKSPTPHLTCTYSSTSSPISCNKNTSNKIQKQFVPSAITFNPTAHSSSGMSSQTQAHTSHQASLDLVLRTGGWASGWMLQPSLNKHSSLPLKIKIDSCSDGTEQDLITF